MVDGKAKEAWSRTSSLMALIANVNRSKKSKTYKPDDFNPYAREMKKAQKIRITKDNVAEIRRAFTGS